MNERHLVIHAHMYQPPRENPWLEAVDMQESARPWHDWTERVTAESYEPNAFARILDEERKIVRIVNNYEKISFNFGPTLLGWLKMYSKPLYELIIEADRKSAEERSGHGNAIAQCYNHIIMPLATTRDKITQAVWGIEDFTRHFSRPPEGMWLPETAVDTETLEILAAHGVKFTILAPHQAHMVKGPGDTEWTHLDGQGDGENRQGPDTKIPYLVRLPSGAEISVFFYHGPVARAVAFEGLLNDGVQLAERLIQIFSERPEPEDRCELAHIATDGESYGHHSRFGEMALAYCLYHIEKNGLAKIKITNYGEFLENHPPEWEAKIRENTAWSCYHGVGRWRADCGCNTGAHPEWNQKWRASLREAMDWLSGELARTFEEKGRAVFKDPWLARDRYIEVVLDRSEENIERFLGEHGLGEKVKKVEALKLLEMQRYGLLMFTSCGWFFDDISGIEALQVFQYACRAIELNRALGGKYLEKKFLRMLREAKSNVQENGDGETLYMDVKKKAFGLERVGAHYAIGCLYGDPLILPPTEGLYCYDIRKRDYQYIEQAGGRLALGSITVQSRITGEEGESRFAAMRTGSHNPICRLGRIDEKDFEEFKKSVACPFSKGDFSAARREMERHAEGALYYLKDLFMDRQREILSAAASERTGQYNHACRRIYEEDHELMALLRDFFFFAGAPAPKVPKSFLAAAECAINQEMLRAIEADPPDIEKASGWLREMNEWGIKPGPEEIAPVLERRLLALFEMLKERPDLEGIKRLRGLLNFAKKFANGPPFALKLPLWEAQNVWYGMTRSLYNKTARDETVFAEFVELGRDLEFNIKEVL